MGNIKRFKGNKGKYLAEFTNNPTQSVKEITEKIGISTDAYYGWVASDPDFTNSLNIVLDAYYIQFEQKIKTNAEAMSTALLELINQTEDKRTRLEAIKFATSKFGQEKNDLPKVSKIEFEWSE